MHSKFIDIILSYKEFKDNWNGYNAKRIPNKVIDKAHKVIECLWDEEIINVSPTARESIQLDFADGSEMEIFENKVIEFLEGVEYTSIWKD